MSLHYTVERTDIVQNTQDSIARQLENDRASVQIQIVFNYARDNSIGEKIRSYIYQYANSNSTSSTFKNQKSSYSVYKHQNKYQSSITISLNQFAIDAINKIKESIKNNINTYTEIQESNEHNAKYEEDITYKCTFNSREDMREKIDSAYKHICKLTARCSYE